jgi:adenine-specific DNA-methyltransferase
MTGKPKLELNWIGKETRPRLEPRILLSNPEKSYHARHRISEMDLFDNRLIFGDNLLALKALEQEFKGKVKCVFIDPPYNTGSAFSHYDDGLEHSIWLGLMRDRIQIIERLLSNDGSLWITIDDNEAHYLKVVCDEIFGRHNFVANVVWQKKYAPANDALWLSDSHDHILVYARCKENWRPNKLPRTIEQDSLYRNQDNDPRGPWMSDNYTCAKTADERPNLFYAIRNPNTGAEIWPRRTRVWAFDQAAHRRHIQEDLIYWGRDGTNSTPRFKKFRSNLRSDGRVASTVWLHEEVGHNQDANREQQALNPQDPFKTPKPEKLLFRILSLASNRGDIVLDSFAGSGTTGAVAHKMGRRWIMVEIGEHCHTHIIPRLKKVIDGRDPGGVTDAVGWHGGGGFRYYRLAPSLLQRDKWDNWIINRHYDAGMLAEAVCKLEGFDYAPSDTLWWQHGFSSESDFIYVTTQSLGAEQLQGLSEDVGAERTLLVCCAAFRGKADRFQNLTIKKIPTMVLTKCEWGHDDYSLNVANLPMAQQELEPLQANQKGGRNDDRQQKGAGQAELFAERKP